MHDFAEDCPSFVPTDFRMMELNQGKYVQDIYIDEGNTVCSLKSRFLYNYTIMSHTSGAKVMLKFTEQHNSLVSRFSL